ncbi:hypothetical protein OHB25_01640 [Streptomyces mirabilis]|uniref:hypothetical protein n=1 Tax=Streptomyces mirabilis TaxID=68239 RepID=UPI002E1D531E
MSEVDATPLGPGRRLYESAAAHHERPFVPLAGDQAATAACVSFFSGDAFLTGRGEALMPILAGLAEWGAGLEDPPPSYTDRTAWSVVAMRPTAPGEAARFDTLTELAVGEEKLWLQGDGERVRVETGPAPVKRKLRLICDHKDRRPPAAGSLPSVHQPKPLNAWSRQRHLLADHLVTGSGPDSRSHSAATIGCLDHCRPGHGSQRSPEQPCLFRECLMHFRSDFGLEPPHCESPALEELAPFVRPET